MYKEKHTVKNHYSSHKLSRYLDVYELNTVDCSADKTTGYKGDTITITGTPAWNQKTSSYSVTGATLTGNQFDFTGSDVTAQANYETAKNLTLQTDGHGQIAANKTSGFIGDQVTLSNSNPELYYAFSGYTITGANLTGDKFNFIGSDVTAKAWYTMTGVPVHNIFSGGTVDFEFRLSDPGEHTYFLNYTSSPSSITDQYIVLQYDYKSYHDRTTPGSASVYFNFNYTGGSMPAYSMSYNDSYNRLLSTNNRKMLLWSLNSTNSYVHYNNDVAQIYMLNSKWGVAAINSAMNEVEHHYKVIAKTNGSTMSAYVDGTYYGDIANANDPVHTSNLLVRVAGTSYTGYLHNVSYVSTSSWNDATAFNG